MFKILIINDNPKINDLLKSKLCNNNISIDTQKRKEVLINIELNLYDLIITDLNFQEVTPKEILSNIRRKNPYIYVFICTDSYQNDTKQLIELANIGIDKYYRYDDPEDTDKMIQEISEISGITL